LVHDTCPEGQVFFYPVIFILDSERKSVFSAAEIPEILKIVEINDKRNVYTQKHHDPGEFHVT